MRFIFFFILLGLLPLSAQGLWDEFENPTREVPSDTGSAEATPEAVPEMVTPQVLKFSSVESSSSAGNNSELPSSSSLIADISSESSSATVSKELSSSSEEKSHSSSVPSSSSSSVPTEEVVPRALVPVVVPGKQIPPKFENRVGPNRGHPPKFDPRQRSTPPQVQKAAPENKPKPIVFQGKKPTEESVEDLNKNLLDISAGELQTQAPITLVPSMEGVDQKYRSPKTAAFLSLFLPGAGQYYIGGTGNVIRGILYSGLEVFAGVSLYYFGVYKYQEAEDLYREKAQSFDLQKSEKYHQGLRAEAVASGIEEELDREFFFDREQWCRGLFDRGGDRVASCQKMEENHIRLVGNSQFKVKNEETYFAFLEDARWAAGWVDAEQESFAPILQGAYDNTGTSKKRDEYLSARKDAKDYADLQPVFLTLLIANHIVSALDAAWFATQHNKSLYKSPLHTSIGLTPQGDLAGTFEFRWAF